MQNWKKECVFGHTDKFWKVHDGQIKKNACKNAYLGSIFIPEKYVIRVLFVCQWTSLIPPLAIRVAPPRHNSGISYAPYSFRVRIRVKVRIRIRIKMRDRIGIRVRLGLGLEIRVGVRVCV